MQLAKPIILALMFVPATLLAADPSPVGSMEDRAVPPWHISIPASEESIKRPLIGARTCDREAL
jgi:hypothetical protein